MMSWLSSGCESAFHACCFLINSFVRLFRRVCENFIIGTVEIAFSLLYMKIMIISMEVMSILADLWRGCLSRV